MIAFQIANYLGQTGVNVIFNQKSINPALSLQMFEESLARINSLLIVCGAVHCSWVEQRIKKAFQTLAAQYEKASLKSCWIYMLPPYKSSGMLERFPKVIKLKFSEFSGQHALG
ncbi:hypothetical protein JXJ21_12160 [candidate division KSB1 bacterium]|nr:hypothetical protein [candidate division KSB1 bacterium]